MNRFIKIAHAEKAIRLVREYRSRLVADSVTGRLDVREAAAGLPIDDVEPGGATTSGDVTENPDEIGEAEAA